PNARAQKPPSSASRISKISSMTIGYLRPRSNSRSTSQPTGGECHQGEVQAARQGRMIPNKRKAGRNTTQIGSKLHQRGHKAVQVLRGAIVNDIQVLCEARRPV